MVWAVVCWLLVEGMFVRWCTHICSLRQIQAQMMSRQMELGLKEPRIHFCRDPVKCTCIGLQASPAGSHAYSPPVHHHPAQPACGRAGALTGTCRVTAGCRRACSWMEQMDQFSPSQSPVTLDPEINLGHLCCPLKGTKEKK